MKKIETDEFNQLVKENKRLRRTVIILAVYALLTLVIQLINTFF